MSLYESVFIARQDISSAQAEALIDSLSEIVTNNGGTIAKREYWGLRNLAYRIKKNRKGHYALLGIDGGAEAVAEMERNMRLHDDILRFLTVRVDEIEEEPSAILRSRDDRGPRGPRGRRDEGARESRPRRAESPAAASSTGDTATTGSDTENSTDKGDQA